MFWTIPPSTTGNFSLYTQQTCMTYTTAVCTVKNSWWWTEKLSETCKVSIHNKFEKLVHLVGFIVRNSVSSFQLHPIIKQMTSCSHDVIELWSKTCCYQNTRSNHNCCAQIFQLILNNEADTQNITTHYLHLNSFRSKSRSTSHLHRKTTISPDRTLSSHAVQFNCELEV
jgi:hypothetical protein